MPERPAKTNSEDVRQLGFEMWERTASVDRTEGFRDYV